MLKHLNLKNEIKEWELPRRRSFIKRPIRNEEELINEAVCEDKIETLTNESVFQVVDNKIVIYAIELFSDVYISMVNDILRFLDVELISFISPHQFLVRSDESNINNIKNICNYKKYRESIKSIHIIEAKEKLSEKLIGLAKECSDTNQRTEISGMLMPKFNQSEYNFLIKSLLEEFPNSNIKGREYIVDSLLLFSANATINEIKEIASKGFIYKLSEVSVFQLSNVEKEAEQKKIKSSVGDMPIVCVIDTGIHRSIFGNLLVDYCEDPDLPTAYNNCKGHGTKVGSVAIYGESILEETELTPECKICGCETSDHSADYLPLLVNFAIDKYKGKTKVYNLSMNYITYNKFYLELANELDKLVQKNNILLVNSCSNVPEEIINDNILSYPDCITKYPCQLPSTGKNIFSVGAYASKESPLSLCKKGEISPYCPIGKIANIDDSPVKPNIFCKGGNIESNGRKIIYNNDLMIKVVNNKGNIESGLGTSFSAPYISNILATLNYIYPNIENVETLKAILLSFCKIEKNNDNFLFKLEDKRMDICLSEKNIVYYTEGKMNPKPMRRNLLTGKKVMGSHEIKFYVPPEARKFRIFLVSSDNYEFSLYDITNSKIETKISKMGRKEYLSKDDSQIYYLNEYSPVNFAEFEVKRGYDVFWTITLVPACNEYQDFEIRYGLVVNLILDPQDMGNYNGETYNKVVEQCKGHIITTS